MGRPGHVNEFAHFVNAIIENSYINGVHLRIDGAAKFSHMWFYLYLLMNLSKNKE